MFSYNTTLKLCHKDSLETQKTYLLFSKSNSSLLKLSSEQRSSYVSKAGCLNP